jgi:hypothetical protein
LSSAGNSVSTTLSPLRARPTPGQAVIGLRADDDIDDRRAADDFLAFGLGHTAGDRDHQVAAFGIALSLELGQPSELRIDLFGGLFTDVTGVDQNQIRGLDGIDGLIAVTGQRVAHALAVIDIHLAAIGLDEDLLCCRRPARRPGFGSGVW